MLTDLSCKSTIKLALLLGKSIKKFDRQGLYLYASPSGDAHWRYKYRINGKENVVSFGRYPLISLSEARERHFETARQLARGVDPSAHRKEAKRQAKADMLNTFELAGRAWLNHRKASLSLNHTETIQRRLEKDLFCTIGHLPLKVITAQRLLEALQKIEARGSNEIARRSLQYAGKILTYAKRLGLVDVNVTDDLEGALKPRKRGFFPSMTIEELPEFLHKLDRNEACLTPDTRDAMEMLMLTLVRTNELVGCEWKEFNLDKQVWIVPGSRMKKRIGQTMPLDHVVPLSRQLVQLLKKRRRKEDLLEAHLQSKYVFQSYKGPHKHMHPRTIGKALFAMGYQGIHTGHGFRSLGMGIAKEKLGYRHEVVDRQLAHIPKDEIERSYDRAKYLQERTIMMQRLSDYVDLQRMGEKQPDKGYAIQFQSPYHYHAPYQLGLAAPGIIPVLPLSSQP